MAPQHAFMFDYPLRFVMGIGMATGMAWWATIGEAPTLVSDSKHKYANGLPGAETEHGFVRRMSQQGTSKIKRFSSEDGKIIEAPKH